MINQHFARVEPTMSYDFCPFIQGPPIKLEIFQPTASFLHDCQIRSKTYIDSKSVHIPHSYYHIHIKLVGETKFNSLGVISIPSRDFLPWVKSKVDLFFFSWSPRFVQEDLKKDATPTNTTKIYIPYRAKSISKYSAAEIPIRVFLTLFLLEAYSKEIRGSTLSIVCMMENMHEGFPSSDKEETNTMLNFFREVVNNLVEVVDVLLQDCATSKELKKKKMEQHGSGFNMKYYHFVVCSDFCSD